MSVVQGRIAPSRPFNCDTHFVRRTSCPSRSCRTRAQPAEPRSTTEVTGRTQVAAVRGPRRARRARRYHRTKRWLPSFIFVLFVSFVVARTGVARPAFYGQRSECRRTRCPSYKNASPRAARPTAGAGLVWRANRQHGGADTNTDGRQNSDEQANAVDRLKPLVDAAFAITRQMAGEHAAYP